MFRKALLGGVAFAALSLTTTGSAFAQYDVNSRIDALEHELRELKSQVGARDAKIEALEQKTTAIDNLPKFDSKKLKVTSADGKYSMEIFGRIQIDAMTGDDDDLNAGHNIGSSIEFRRARMGVKGKLAGDWGYKLEVGYDVGADEIGVEEVYIEYKGLGFADVTVGKFKAPWSLEEQTSSRFISFMERGMMNEFAPGKNTGLGLSTGGDNYSFAVAYQFEGGLVDGSDGTSDEDQGIIARGTFAPVTTDTELVHLGLSGYYMSDQDGTERVRARPEIHVSDRLIDTGNIAGVSDIWTINPEVAVAFGPFSAQAEYVFAEIGRDGAGTSDMDASGGYFFVSYFLTGESRAAFYEADAGKFDRPKVNGAWEVLGRVSYLNLDDTNFPSADRGEETNYTLGLNHYFNPNVRALVNYVYADVDHPAAGVESEDAQILGARLQVDF